MLKRTTMLCVAVLAAAVLAGCQQPSRVATESARPPGNYGHTTMPDAWLTFLWACQNRDAAAVRDCLTGAALKEFETAAAADEADALNGLHKTFAETDIVINPADFDTRAANGLKILDRATGQTIQIGAVRMRNVETNSLKLPQYKVERFDWDR